MNNLLHFISIFERFSDSLNEEENKFINPSVWDNINDSIKRVYRIEKIFDEKFQKSEKQPLFSEIDFNPSWIIKKSPDVEIVGKSNAFIQLKEEIIGYKISDVIEVTLLKLYPEIICRLYEEGFLDPDLIHEPYYYLVHNYNKILSSLSKIGKKVFRLYINYFFGLKLANEERNKVTGRGYQIMEHFSKYEGWLYSDTDVFFIKDDVDIISVIKKDLDLFEIPYEIKILKEAVFFGKKKYMSIDQQGLGYMMGFRPNKK